MRSALALTAAVLAAVSLAACGGWSADTRLAPAPTRCRGQGVRRAEVGTEGTYSPFTFHDPATNELTGYDVDVITAVAEQLGVKAEFSETPFDAIFAGLEAERYDVVANQVSITDERQAKYDFSTPYTVSTGVVVTRPTTPR